MAQVKDNTAEWNMMKLAETGIPLGFEYFSINPNVPLGSLPLIGGTYSRTLYKDLWDWVQTQTGYLKTESEWTILFNKNNGNVPFYSSGDGSTTFRVPSLKCWVKSGSSISEVGSYLEAGLPNITGTIREIEPGIDQQFFVEDVESISFNGAFCNLYGTYSVRAFTGPDTGCKAPVDVSFDASRSNPIYGESDTVQPPSVVGLWLVKAFSVISNVGNKDLQSVITRMDEIDTNRLKLCIYTD